MKMSNISPQPENAFVEEMENWVKLSISWVKCGRSEIPPKSTMKPTVSMCCGKVAFQLLCPMLKDVVFLFNQKHAFMLRRIFALCSS